MRYFLIHLLENFLQSLPGTLVQVILHTAHSCFQYWGFLFSDPKSSSVLIYFTGVLSQQLLERGHMGDKLFEALVAAFSLCKFVGFFFCSQCSGMSLLLSKFLMCSYGLQLWEMFLSYFNVCFPLFSVLFALSGIYYSGIGSWTCTSVFPIFLFLFPIIFLNISYSNFC